MKLHANTLTGINAVTAYGTGYVEVNGQRVEGAMILRAEGEVLAWEVAGFESLDSSHFDALLAHEPELVLLGTGERQRFPHPRLTASLAGARIGVEVMDTRAACRTYNILVNEGRRVVAALLPL